MTLSMFLFVMFVGVLALAAVIVATALVAAVMYYWDIRKEEDPLDIRGFARENHRQRRVFIMVAATLLVGLLSIAGLSVMWYLR